METPAAPAHSTQKIRDTYKSLRNKKPDSRDKLAGYVLLFFGRNVPDRVIVPGNSSPMDYLWFSFNIENDKDCTNGDCVVWANRGGGKTFLAAAATMLDCVFKPGSQVRILAGSFDQAGRMYEYLVRMALDIFPDMVEGRIRKSGFTLVNGSRVELLTQSSRSVRGHHIHKLRCDELELFDPAVFDAAQFITQSTPEITASLEICSTMHRPYGLMQSVIDASPAINRPVFRWSIWEVIERCRDRSCSRCPLLPDCRGRAKNANGYYRIDDVISQMQRASRQVWEAEILCLRPRRDNMVFAGFDPARHIRPIGFDSSLRLYRALDFGFVNPFVCLWIQPAHDGTIRVIKEYSRRRETVEVNTRRIIELTPGANPAGVETFCDPAGVQKNDVTGTGPVSVLRRFGIPVRYRKSGILEGIEMVRAHLKDASGRVRLVIDPGCKLLIKSLESYHYHEDNATETPVKDGIHDHSIDALRYFFVNYYAHRRDNFYRY